MGRRTLAWLSLGVLALLTLFAFSDALFSADTVLSHERGDLRVQYLDWRVFAFNELRSGRLPLWNPHLFSGAPFFGGFQSALLYPPNALFLVLPLHQAVDWSIALHVFLAGGLTYAWAARRGLHPAACVVAAAVFMFGGAHLGHVFAGHLSNLCTFAWAPLVFLVIDALDDSPSLGWTLLGMFAVAMTVLAGHPQYVAYLALIAAIYAAACLWRAPRRGLFVLCLAAMAAGGASLSAVQLVTGIQELPELVRRNVSYQFAAQFSFPPENLLTLLSPTVLGTSMTYWGRWYPWEMSIFVGISALVLAAIAAVDGTPARRRFAFTMTGVLVVLALGAYTPVFDALYAWLPGFNRFRGTTKFMIFATLFLAMAAAHGADALVERRRISNAVIGGSTAVGAVLGLAALLVVNAGGQAWWRDMLAAVRNTGQILHTPASSYENAGFLAAAAYDTSFALLIAAVTCFAVVALLMWGRRNRVATWALIVLAVGELVVFSRGTIATTEPQRREATGIKDIVDTYAGDYRVLNLVGSNAAMAAGALDVWGYDPNVVARYAQLLAATQGVHPDDAGQYLSIERDHPVLDLLRCRFIFSVRDRRLSVRERPSHLPHALLVSRYRVLTSRDDVIAAVTDASFDPRREVILEEPPDPAPVEASRPGDVRITTVSSDELLVDANLQSPAILLITDTYARGWRVRAEPGSAQPAYRILPANHALRAIPLAAGQHQLRLEYLPSGFVAGRWVSIVSVVIFAGLTAVVVLRRRSAVKTGA